MAIFPCNQYGAPVKGESENSSNFTKKISKVIGFSASIGSAISASCSSSQILINFGNA
jgi:hypothetical protein